jgi:PAS domain S-box-containing protein
MILRTKGRAKTPLLHGRPKSKQQLEREVEQGLQRIAELQAGQQEAARLAQALRESEEKLRGFLERSHDGIVLIDETGAIAQWNRAQEQITGLKRDEVLGKPLLDIQFRLAPSERRTPEAYQKLKVEMAQYLKTGEAPWVNQSLEKEVQREDGTRRIIQSLTFPIKTDNGYVAGGISRDITVRNRVEEALSESEERFRRIVEAVPSVLRIVDADGRNIYVSPNCEQITGYTAQELERTLTWCVHPDDEQRAREAFERSVREGRGTTDFEYKAVKKDGEIWYATSSWSPVTDKDGKLDGFVVQTVDITARRQTEEALRESERRYRQLAEENARLLEQAVRAVRERSQEDNLPRQEG